MYLYVFDGLEQIHHQMEVRLISAMLKKGYLLIKHIE